MDKYLTLFNNHLAYTNYKNSNNFATPNVSYCELENEVHYNPYVPHDYSQDYFTIESLEDNNTIYLKASNTSVTKTISASTDNGKTWQEYTSINTGSGTTLATLNNGDKLLIKGQNGTYGTSSLSNNQFISTGQFEAKGNIMSLISGDSFTNANRLTMSYTFYRLFYSCSGLISAENLILPAITLTGGCYQGMFSSCTSLTTAPKKLPATTLANECYSSMFYSCTSLTTAPELPATTLVDLCYQYMFDGCTSLATAPELPATRLTTYCYRLMFRGCTSLTTAPELPATTLAVGCYYNMFDGCTSLNYIKAMFIELTPTNATSSWVRGVASTGTFVKNASATWTTTGDSGIPTGWTVQTASA